MTFTDASQIIGTIGFFILFCVKFYIAVVNTAWQKAGRTAVLWTTLYIFFLFFLRVIALLKLLSVDIVLLISAWTVFIPLFATLIQLWLGKKIDKGIDGKYNVDHTIHIDKTESIV